LKYRKSRFDSPPPAARSLAPSEAKAIRYQSIGCARFVFNHFLTLRKEVYEIEGGGNESLVILINLNFESP
jgi:hypothetical protein